MPQTTTTSLPLPSPTLNNLNQPPILSPPTIPIPFDDHPIFDADESGFDSQDVIANIPSTSYSITTRSTTL